MAKETKVTRIKAKDDTAPKSKAASTKTAPKKAVKAKTVKKKSSDKKPGPFAQPFINIAAYFAGAWYELRQVRWPTRRATWVLTLAVVIFSAFFTVIIVLLDLLFKYLFELIIT